MKLLVTIVLGIGLSSITSAQTIERQVIGSAGIAVANSKVMVDMTVGESVVSSESTSDVILNQGFQQGAGDAVVTSVQLQDLNTAISIFPNPASQYLNIASDLYKEGITMLKYQIINGQGQVVSSGVIDSKSATLGIGHMASGGYVLRLIDTRASYTRNIRFVKI